MQKRRFDKRTTDAKAYSVGDYVWVFHEVVSLKGTKKLLKKWRGPFQITEMHPGVRFLSIELWMLSSLRERQTAQLPPR